MSVADATDCRFTSWTTWPGSMPAWARVRIAGWPIGVGRTQFRVAFAKTIQSAKPNPPESRAAQRTAGFVDPPGAFGWFQFLPASLVQFGCVALHPGPNGGVGSRQTPLQEQFLDVPIRKREPQIPTDGAKNDLGFEVPPFKQSWPRFGHRLAAYQTCAPRSCNTSIGCTIAPAGITAQEP